MSNNVAAILFAMSPFLLFLAAAVLYYGVFRVMDLTTGKNDLEKQVKEIKDTIGNSII